jgi:ribosome-associated protein
MAEVLEITPGVTIPLELVEIRVSRSSGPGGQHANVTASRVEAVLDLTALADAADTPGNRLSEAQRLRLITALGPRVSAVAQDTRSQLRNRELACARLAAKLAAALVVQAPRRPSRPSRGSVERRLSAKRRHSARKQERRPPPDA